MSPGDSPVRQRTIELTRDTNQDPWSVRTEVPI